MNRRTLGVGKAPRKVVAELFPTTWLVFRLPDGKNVNLMIVEKSICVVP
jgi:hypothetical protein